MYCALATDKLEQSTGQKLDSSSAWVLERNATQCTYASDSSAGHRLLAVQKQSAFFALQCPRHGELKNIHALYMRLRVSCYLD